MSLLELAKAVEARLRQGAPAYEPDEGNELTLAYRTALRKVWRLLAEAESANPTACREALGEVRRLTDELGMVTADRLRHTWEVSWMWETGKCPRCGGLAHE